MFDYNAWQTWLGGVSQQAQDRWGELVDITTMLWHASPLFTIIVGVAVVTSVFVLLWLLLAVLWRLRSIFRRTPVRIDASIGTCGAGVGLRRDPASFHTLPFPVEYAETRTDPVLAACLVKLGGVIQEGHSKALEQMRLAHAQTEERLTHSFNGALEEIRVVALKAVDAISGVVATTGETVDKAVEAGKESHEHALAAVIAGLNENTASLRSTAKHAITAVRDTADNALTDEEEEVCAQT